MTGARGKRVRQSRGRGRGRGAQRKRRKVLEAESVDAEDAKPTAEHVEARNESTVEGDEETEKELVRLREALADSAKAEDLAAFSAICSRVGAGRALLAVRGAPRAILKVLSEWNINDTNAVADALVHVACAYGDTEAARRARSWGARALVTAVRNARIARYAHSGAPSYISGVAPRDVLDDASIRALAVRICKALDNGTVVVHRLVCAAKALTTIVDFPAVHVAVEAVLRASLRVPASLTEEQQLLPDAFVDAVLSCGDTIDVKARGALVATCERALTFELQRVQGILKMHPFLPLYMEEALCEPIGLAAADNLHIHWALLDDDKICGALLRAVEKACIQADGERSLVIRVPRRERAFIASLLAYANGTPAASRAIVKQIREKAAVARIAPLAVERLSIAAGADENVMGTDTLTLVGRIAGARVVQESEIEQCAHRDGAQFCRALMLAATYAQWANVDKLKIAASNALKICRRIHADAATSCEDIDECVAWWKQRGDAEVVMQ